MAYAKVRDSSSPRARNVFTQNGLVAVFLMACAGVFMHCSGKKNRVIASLDEQLAILHAEKTALLQQQEDLRLQINSQSDPAWIQLILMKGLGLVPEGQLKVYFHND